MTTMEYRVVTVSGEVRRVTVRVVDMDGVERWTVVGAPRFSRSADAWSSPTAAVMCDAHDRGLLVREIVPPGEMTRDEAVVAERSRCAALAQSVAEAIDTDAARETASAIVDEMLRDRSRSVETPAQAYGRGRLAGLAEGARIALALAAESEGAHAGGRAMTRDETEASPAALEACGVGPRRGDARPGRSVARRGLPVAAATWCPTCGGSGRRLLAGWREVRCDECEATGRVAAEGGA